MKLDILAFAAHPDDVELGCSGTLLKHIRFGKTAGIADLTRGELGTRGNSDLREEEAEKASRILGVEVRENLSFEDGFFLNNKENQIKVVQIIRKYRPEIIFANAIFDRHPDHGRASQLVSEACFLSGLIKIKTTLEGKVQEVWKPKSIYHYIQDYHIKPDFVVDITDVMEGKIKSIRAFSSQFYNPQSDEPETPISSPAFIDFLYARASDFGRLIGVKYAEGFTVERPPGIKDIFDIL